MPLKENFLIRKFYEWFYYDSNFEGPCGRPGFDPSVGKIPWRRERLPAPVFWPGEFHVLYSPWGCKESDMTERLSLHFTSSLERVVGRCQPPFLGSDSWNCLAFVSLSQAWAKAAKNSPYSQLFYMELSWKKTTCELMKPTAKAFNAGSLKHRLGDSWQPDPSFCMS